MADARARISWLHVSDLHVTRESLGHRAARRPGSELWAEVLRGFLADLDEQLDVTGLRPDLVLVTGDLAYSGATKQYDDLDADLLQPLLAHLRSRGCDAVPFAVPGNHDVQRPSGAARRGYLLLRQYDALDDQDEDLRDLRTELWQRRDASFLAPLFANYVAWTERSLLPELADRTRPSGLRIEGLYRSHLPGDLSVVAARDGLRLLLVGLNSAWLQFDGGDFKGKLHVPLEQLHAALSPNEHAALRRFDEVDASLLLMHHPRDWLSPTAVRTFDGYVYPARDERFTAFMFGHMHEARSETSSGNGGAMRYFYQSPSLFGLEHYAQTQARLDVGYTLGALYEDEEIRLWVRRLNQHGRFDVDPDLHRETDGALVLRAGRARTIPRVTLLPSHERADQTARASDRAQLGAWLLSRHDKLELLAPTGTFSYPFDEIYIPLEIAMQEAWRGGSPDGDLLHGMGRDIALPEIFARARDDREVMIFGNPGAGKTTTLEKICHQLLIEGGEAVGLPRTTLPLLLPLRHATREDLAQEDPLLPLALREIVRGGAPLSADVLARLWAQGGLLLLLDGLDEVADAELRDGLIRHVVESAPARRRRAVRCVVSSRFSGVTGAIREVLDGGFLRLDVRPLRRDRIEALVHGWFRAAKCWQAAPRTAEERARVEAEAHTEAERVLAELRRIEHEDFEFKSLVATPLLLTLLCAVALANGQIPHKRPEFYQRCLEVLLRRYTHKTGRSAPVQEPEVLRLLQEAAHGLHEAHRRDGLSVEAFVGWASRRADRSGRARVGPVEAAELLEWLHQHAGVLTKLGPDDYAFSHLTFQEYLAAQHIAYGGQEPIEALADRFGDSWWQEVTLLCLALPLRRTFAVFMARVLEGDRWLAEAPGEDEGAPEVHRESKPPMQLLRECWEDAEERTVEPFLRVLERPRSGGLLGWVRSLLGRAEGAKERIDRQRIGVMQLLLGETDPRLVTLAATMAADPKESEAVRALAAELVVRARRGMELREAARVPPEVWDARAGDGLVDEPWASDDDVVDRPHAGLAQRLEEDLADFDTENADEQEAEPDLAELDDVALEIAPEAPAEEAEGSETVRGKGRYYDDGNGGRTRKVAQREAQVHAEQELDRLVGATSSDRFAADEPLPDAVTPPAIARPEPEPAPEPKPAPEPEQPVFVAQAKPAAASKPEPTRPIAPKPKPQAFAEKAFSPPASEAARRPATPPPTVTTPSTLASRAAATTRSVPLAQPPAPMPSAGAGPPGSAAPAVPVLRPPAEPIPEPALVPAGALAPAAFAPAGAPASELAPSSPALEPMVLASPAPSPAPPRSGAAAVPSSSSRTSLLDMAPPAGSDIDVDDCIEPITKIRFLWVSGGHFMMGSDEDDPESREDERPRHPVQLRGFWLAETPVTNAQYAEYTKAVRTAGEPLYWRDRELSGRDQPVVGVGRHEAQAFCTWLGRASGWSIALPSEAQWEYAARGTEGRRYPWGNDPVDETRACFGLSSRTKRTAPVGQYPRGRGPFGHLDLAGNVWEWCRDVGHPRAYALADVWSQVDPVIEDVFANQYVCRGGAWNDAASALRSTRRSLRWNADVSAAQGFRVCRIPDDR